MDTPKRSQIGTPISKFEDSPVFSYISNLSPLEPVRSVHITQSFQSFNFSSIPSIFASPQISQRESKFLQRHQFFDLSKTEFSVDNADESNSCNGLSVSVVLSECSTGSRGKNHAGSSVEEFNAVPSTEHKKLAIKLCQTLQYDCSSRCSNSEPCYGSNLDNDTGTSGTVTPLVQVVEENPNERHTVLESEVQSQETCQFEQVNEEDPSDWENLISDVDADGLLIFDGSPGSDACNEKDQRILHTDADSVGSLHAGSPYHNKDDSQEPLLDIDSMEQNQKLNDTVANPFASIVLRSPQSNIGNAREARVPDFHGHVPQDPDNHPCEVKEQNETDHTPPILLSACQYEHEPIENTDGDARGNLLLCSKVDSQKQRGLLRRCLVFEHAGVRQKNLEHDSKTSESDNMLCVGKSSSDDKQLVTPKNETSSSPCVLPGIGLHLNALTNTSKGSGMFNQGALASGRCLTSIPKSAGSIRSLKVAPKPLDKPLALISIDGESNDTTKEANATQDTIQVPEPGMDEELNQSISKYKRRRLESDGEGESCKHCTCKKSKCLKLYCECFAAGVYCVEPCLCRDCFNKPIYEDTVLATRKQIESRNPLAFAPKVIRSQESVMDAGEECNKTPASARHKRGCNCKKSNCLKKYCECFQGGVGCSSSCRCERCKNKYGLKDGTAPASDETEVASEELETTEKDVPDEKLQLIQSKKKGQKCSDLAATPFWNCSLKPPSSLVAVGSSPCIDNTCQKLKGSVFLYSELQFDKCFQTAPDDETPEILRGDRSPVIGVKIASPNKKRVSPPHKEHGLSPARRAGWTTMLQSIRSFPSLNGRNNFVL